MRIILSMALAASLTAGAALAQTPAPAPAPAAPAAAPATATPAAATAAPAMAGKPSAKSGLLDLYKDAKAKEVLKKHIPQVVDFLDANGTDMIPPEMTLADLVNIPEAGVTADMITTIDKDLTAL
jgi:hypothetical protein